LFGEHALYNGKKCLNENPQVVKITLLDTSPDARPIPNDDRKRIEQDHTDSPILVHDSKDGQNESIAFKGAMMHLESFPPRVLPSVIYCYSEGAAGTFRGDGRNFTNWSGKYCDIFLREPSRVVTKSTYERAARSFLPKTDSCAFAF
jgi:hypothetical protein